MRVKGQANNNSTEDNKEIVDEKSLPEKRRNEGVQP